MDFRIEIPETERQFNKKMINIILLFLTFFCFLLSGCVLDTFRKVQLPFRSNSTPAEFFAWSKAMDFTSNHLEMQGRMNQWRIDNGVYKKDERIDYPRHHLITHAWRSGDCDDWSSMFMEASYQVGYKSFLMSVDGFHTVNFFKHENLYYHNSNWKTVRGPFFNRYDIAKSIKMNWKTAIIRDRKLKEIGRLKNE